ncbi:MAG: hypothetical protein UZ05_CHB002000025 [Chlorobi bacterium OLB5]|nr:MAG: hypothetical protein UZ05_CHB002000025 [Chlorobi bacterium OLB5]
MSLNQRLEAKRFIVTIVPFNALKIASFGFSNIASLLDNSMTSGHSKLYSILIIFQLVIRIADIPYF